MAYDVILLTFSKPIAAVLKQRSMWQQMSGSKRAGYTFDSHSRTQRKGYDKMGQVSGCRALTKRRETATEHTGRLLRERLDVVFDE